MKTEIALWAIGLLLTAPMALLAVDQHPRTPEVLRMACRLEVVKKTGPDPKEFVGVLVLTNTSTEPLEIKYQTNPLEYLDLDVKDEKGLTLPKSIASYGFIYSPISSEKMWFTLTVSPGETYRAEVVLFAQVDEKKHPVTPGKYTVEAVYKWNAPGYRSNKVTVEVTTKSQSPKRNT
jgi:hypothetical protein